MARTAKTIAIANQRPASGKTTTAVNLSASLAIAEHPTLLIEADPNLEAGIDLRDVPRTHSISDVLLGKTPLARTIGASSIPNLDVLPANFKLWQFDIDLLFVRDREQLLAREIAKLTGLYEFIVIDCAAGLGLSTINALVAAQTLIVPVIGDVYHPQDLAETMQAMATVRDNLNRALTLGGVLLCKADRRNPADQQLESVLRKDYRVFPTVIPKSTALAQARAIGIPILMHDAGCAAAEAYLQFTKSVLALDDNTSAERKR